MKPTYQQLTHGWLPPFIWFALVLIGNPSVADAVETGPDAWRDKQPAHSAQPKLVLPTFTQTVLSNGLTVLVVEQAQLPLVVLRLVTQGGSALDPSDHHGLSSLVYGMLDEGAGERNALAFSDAVADLGASLSTSSSIDHGAVQISGLSRHQDALMALLSDAVLRPSLAEKDFIRLKSQVLASLEAQRGSPQGLAFMHLPSILYGPSHPLGHPASGTPESVQRVTLKALKAHHQQLLSPARSAFIAVGAISLKEATALAEKHLGRWKGTSTEAAFTLPAVQADPRKEIVFIDKPDSPQTMVILARPLFGRGHPDEDALVLANGVWGGGFASRLNMNLREDKGYTYGAGSRAGFRNNVGNFIAYSALQRVHTVAGLNQFFFELERLPEHPVTTDELHRVKQGLIRSLPGDFDRISNIASAATQIFVYQRPLDDFAQKAVRIETVALDRVQEVALKYLNPEVMKVLMVGDAKTVLPDLKRAKLGSVHVKKP
ncbi:MAG: insulinase family protein [Myxococcales bacterium]|nr:insulinase family protein [Myxococcales bacterium]